MYFTFSIVGKETPLKQNCKESLRAFTKPENYRSFAPGLGTRLTDRCSQGHLGSDIETDINTAKKINFQNFMLNFECLKSSTLTSGK